MLSATLFVNLEQASRANDAVTRNQIYPTGRTLRGETHTVVRPTGARSHLLVQRTSLNSLLSRQGNSHRLIPGGHSHTDLLGAYPSLYTHKHGSPSPATRECQLSYRFPWILSHVRLDPVLGHPSSHATVTEPSRSNENQALTLSPLYSFHSTLLAMPDNPCTHLKIEAWAAHSTAPLESPGVGPAQT